MNCVVEKIIFQVFWDSAFGGKLFTAYNAEKKNRIHRQYDFALDLPLNSLVNIKGNLLQRVRRIKIFS